MKFQTALVWLRRDLRLDDQPALFQACRQAQNVIPIYCFDPRQWRSTPTGFPKTGAHRTKFLLESLADLNASLIERGGALWLRHGKPERVLPQLVEQTGAEAVFYHREIADEEIRVERRLHQRLQDVAILTFEGGDLYHPQDVPFADTPEVFSNFRRSLEKQTEIREPLPSPARFKTPSDPDDVVLPTLADFNLPEPESEPRAALVFKGGETEALARLNHYFWDSNQLRTYKKTRNGLLGADYSSKFSTWLALGCISPRRIAHEVRRYEQARTKNDSTYWLVFELIWRDFFRYAFRKHGNRFFHEDGINGRRLPIKPDPSMFEAWVQGRTGIPFVDANMIELTRTGFMSNRGRQNVASFLTHDLQAPWWWGAEYFESQLVDYDVYSNWGNWAYAAGVGADPRGPRHFNILKQATTYDAKAKYVKHWLPELAQLSAILAHEPHEAPDQLPKDSIYRRPIVRLKETAERFYRHNRQN